MIDIDMLVYRMRRFSPPQKSMLLKMLKEQNLTDLAKIINDRVMKGNRDLSHPAYTTQKTSRKESVVEYRDVNYVFNNLLKIELSQFENWQDYIKTE